MAKRFKTSKGTLDAIDFMFNGLDSEWFNRTDSFQIVHQYTTYECKKEDLTLIDLLALVSKGNPSIPDKMTKEFVEDCIEAIPNFHEVATDAGLDVAYFDSQYEQDRKHAEEKEEVSRKTKGRKLFLHAVSSVLAVPAAAGLLFVSLGTDALPFAILGVAAAVGWIGFGRMFINDEARYITSENTSPPTKPFVNAQSHNPRENVATTKIHNTLSSLLSQHPEYAQKKMANFTNLEAFLSGEDAKLIETPLEADSTLVEPTHDTKGNQALEQAAEELEMILQNKRSAWSNRDVTDEDEAIENVTQSRSRKNQRRQKGN